LRGKCRYCKTNYGVSSLVIETIFGVTFLLLYTIVIKTEPTLLLAVLWLVYYTVLFGVLGVMALYDRVHSYIPLSFLASYLGLTSIMFVMRLVDSPSLTTVVSPIIVALPFLAIWFITKGKGLGLGDVILFAGVGAFFGSLQGLAVLIISVWIGALVGLYVKYVVKKNKHRVIAIPFAPFIVIAFLIVLFTGIDVFSIAMSFS
jgi:prepilin signal peptidase PulO-like enzyme (type II secretory pathway)